MFETSWCPFCKQARKYMEELKKENPRYNELDIRFIDEEQHPEIAKHYDYYYVPTYFIETEKVHEGVPEKELIRNIFDTAMHS